MSNGDQPLFGGVVGGGMLKHCMIGPFHGEQGKDVFVPGLIDPSENKPLGTFDVPGDVGPALHFEPSWSRERASDLRFTHNGCVTVNLTGPALKGIKVGDGISINGELFKVVALTDDDVVMRTRFIGRAWLNESLMHIEETRVKDWLHPKRSRPQRKPGKPSKLLAAMMKRT